MRHLYSANRSDTKHENKVKNKIVMLLLIISFILFVGSLVQTTIKIKKINKEIKNREDQLSKLTSERVNLEGRLKEVTSDEYIEKQLRDQFNLAKNNEIVLVLPEDSVLEKLVPVHQDETAYDVSPNWRKWIEIFGIQK